MADACPICDGSHGPVLRTPEEIGRQIREGLVAEPTGDLTARLTVAPTLAARLPLVPQIGLVLETLPARVEPQRGDSPAAWPSWEAEQLLDALAVERRRADALERCLRGVVEVLQG